MQLIQTAAARNAWDLHSAAHQAQRLVTATIDNFQENAPTCLRRRLGSKEEKISRKLHLAVGALRRKIDVRDATIGRAIG